MAFDQDVRVDGTSIMSRKFWISDRGGLDQTPGFRSTNYDVAYLQGTMWKQKQIPEVVRSIAMTIDACDEDGVYPTGKLARIGQLNSNRIELLGLFARENAQVTIERDVLISDGAGGYTTETWTGYAQAGSVIAPQYSDDFDDFQTLSVDLLFADPIWYSEEIVEVITGSGTITNPGTVDATNILLEFSGGTNARLTNTTFDPEIWVQIDEAGAIDVNVRNGTAYIGELTVIGSLSHKGDRVWMRFAPGANSVTLSGGGSVTVTFRTPRS